VFLTSGKGREPPLRERREDITPLISRFVEAFARRMGKQIGGIPKETPHAFTSYSWPGNVRELQNLIREGRNPLGERSA
jgi:transcriptional regulator with PAS, ATPase and Fis domain